MSKKKYYRCPFCTFAITEEHKKYARYDFDCPRCGLQKLSDFVEYNIGANK